MFRSIYSDQLSQYYELRSTTLGESARKHELLYLCRFDTYIAGRLKSRGGISASFVNEWVGSLSGKSGSVENEVIVVRQFLAYLGLSGERIALPIVPKCAMIMYLTFSATRNLAAFLSLQTTLS